jgi:hypothetical protein
MGDTTWKDIRGVVGVTVLFFAFISCFMGMRGCVKADAYERVTGKKVSTWDAMWLDLRVQEPAADQVKPTTKKE